MLCCFRNKSFRETFLGFWKQQDSPAWREVGLWRTWKFTSSISIFQVQEEKIIKNQLPQLSFGERICYLLILGKIISSRSSRPGIQSFLSTICSLPWLILDLSVPGLMSIQGLLPGKIFPSRAIMKTHFFLPLAGEQPTVLRSNLTPA